MASGEENEGIRRRRASRFIAAWIAAQLLLPTSYYLGWREPYDERFAWRMFSPTRMVKCQVTLYQGSPRTTRNDLLTKDLHQSWLGWLRRGRLTIAERALEHRCVRARAEGDDEPWVSMHLVCPQPDGSLDVRTDRRQNACASGPDS